MAGRRTELLSVVAARATDPNWLSGLGYIPNPDVVLRKLGRREDVFDDLMADAHVLCVVTARKAAVLSRRINVRAASARRSDRQAAELLRELFKRLDMRRALTSLLDGPLWGRSYLEVMWQVEQGWLLPTDLVDRPQRRFVYGEEGELRVLTKAKALIGDPVPERKILSVRSMHSDDNPYGVAALSACYWPWLFKHNGWKWWAIFAERYGMPWVVGKLGRGASPDEIRQMDNALERAVSDASFRIPADSAVELLQAAGTTSSDVYLAFTNSADAQISKAVLGQTLTTDVGATGSYAAAKVHNLVREDIADADAAAVQSALEELGRWICELNFPSAEPPVVELVEDTVPLGWIEVVKGAREAGIPVPQQWALERTGIPDAAGGLVLGQVADIKPVGRSEEFAEDDALDARLAAQLGQRVGVAGQSRAESLATALRPGGVLWRALEGRQGVWRWVMDLLPLREVGTPLAEALWTANAAGRMQVRAEAADFADTDDFIFGAWPWSEAGEMMRRRRLMTPEEFGALTDEQKALAFSIAGVQDLRALERIRNSLAEAVENGTTMREFANEMAAALQEAELPEFDKKRIEVIWRTNILAAQNAGRYAEMVEPGALKRRPYWRYDAIDDKRTRPAHRALSGKVFRADDPIWDEWYPPNGYQCRCMVTALSKRDVERLGLDVEEGRMWQGRTMQVDGETAQIFPDQGWGFNAAKVTWKPNLQEFPADLVAPWVGRLAKSLAEEASASSDFGGMLKAAGLDREHLAQAALEAGWATERQRTEDAQKLGLSEEEFEQLVGSITHAPDRALVWWYEPAGRWQVVFHRKSVSGLSEVALVWDPQTGIEGLHDQYHEIGASQKNRRAVKSYE